MLDMAGHDASAIRLIPNARISAAGGCCCPRPSRRMPRRRRQRRSKGLSETMVVLGSATPVPLAESQRSVEILPVKGQSLAAESPQDFLREDSSVFLEERGAGGGQADMVLRGGSFEQTLVLLNGFRINDAQTSHHNLDLPVPLEAMDSIQVLEGAGSTLHGVDALSGVVDFLTAAPDHDSIFLRARRGQLRVERGDAAGGGYARAMERARDGGAQFFHGIHDRSATIRNEDASAEAGWARGWALRICLFAASDRSFGANQFYGDYPRGSGRRDGLPRRGRNWAAGRWRRSAIGATRTSSCCSATIRRFTRTTILTARGRDRCGARRICPRARCC